MSDEDASETEEDCCVPRLDADAPVPALAPALAPAPAPALAPAPTPAAPAAPAPAPTLATCAIAAPAVAVAPPDPKAVSRPHDDAALQDFERTGRGAGANARSARDDNEVETGARAAARGAKGVTDVAIVRRSPRVVGSETGRTNLISFAFGTR